MQHTRRIGIAAMVLAIGIAGVQAQEKIGVLDGQTVFRQFHKTKAAMESLRKLEDELRDAQQRMIQQLEQMDENFKKMVAEAEDKGLSEAARARKKSAAEDKLVEMKELELKIRRSDAENRRKLEEQHSLMLRPIIQEIREAAAAVAREKGLALVLDASDTGLGPVVFAEDRLDITEAVMQRLTPKTGEKTP
jgi:Skp family chaperone for outer membrane proteins